MLLRLEINQLPFPDGEKMNLCPTIEDLIYTIDKEKEMHYCISQSVDKVVAGNGMFPALFFYLTGRKVRIFKTSCHVFLPIHVIRIISVFI